MELQSKAVKTSSVHIFILVSSCLFLSDSIRIFFTHQLQIIHLTTHLDYEANFPSSIDIFIRYLMLLRSID